VIAVKALYREGKIEFLEPPPTLTQAPVIIVFLEGEREKDVLAVYTEQMDAVDWGIPMDEEGGRMLVTLHEELAPYRTEANHSHNPEIED